MCTSLFTHAMQFGNLLISCQSIAQLTHVLISYWLSCMVIYKIPFAVFKLFASHLTITKRAINGLLKLYKTMSVQQCLRHIFCEKNWFIFVKLSARNIVDFNFRQEEIFTDISAWWNDFAFETTVRHTNFQFLRRWESEK